MYKNSQGSSVFGVLGLGAIVIALVVGVTAFPKFNADVRSRAQVSPIQTTTFAIQSDSDIANADGSRLTQASANNKAVWLGTATSANTSFLGLLLRGGNVPAGAQITSARLEMKASAASSTALAFKAFLETSGRRSLSSMKLSSHSQSFSESNAWTADQMVSYDVTELIRSHGTSAARTAYTLVLQGSGRSGARRYVWGSTTTGNQPKLVVSYTTSIGQARTPAPTPPPATPRRTNAPAATPVATANPPRNDGGGNGESIFGVVGADTLGTCSAAVHDRYVVRGPDGKLYRTWHPITVPVDAGNPNGPKCSFAHEHGDDPSKSVVDSSMPPFGYVAAQLNPPMDEPHVGFKIFVANAGQRGKAGGTALHSSRIVFHMGTGGVARYTARFHSMEYKVVTDAGWRMAIQGMADSGNSGTICSSPRQGRTVMGLGCKLDSSYEIWANKLTIVNKGRTVGSASASTAVFDAITVMDPADKSRLIYSWSDEAQSKVFNHRNDRSGYRGCKREAYHGPTQWFNGGGSTVYYTDPYGNVVDGGPIKQEISANNSSFSNTSGLGFIATYKNGNRNEPLSQFSLETNSCGPSLGVKN